MILLWLDICQFSGDSLYDSAKKYRLPDLPAFALECLPNRNSLVYGELYGIEHEASTIFRGTLRYEGTVFIAFCVQLYLAKLFHLMVINVDLRRISLFGFRLHFFETSLSKTCSGFSETMATLARIGLFDTEPHPILTHGARPTFQKFLYELLKIANQDSAGALIGEKEISERISTLGHCKEQANAVKAAKTIV